ncbi:MAG: tetratricopeptide repeat protein, partial [Planctomycetota bacterium]|nr:tetratricopeptide repeat protein [Planctomycetota bacterium]
MFSPRRGFVVFAMLFLGSVSCAVPAIGGPVDSTTIMQPGDLELPGQAPEIIAAIGQFRRGDRESALKSLEAAAKTDPELPPPRVMLARMLLFDREVDAARKLLEEVASQQPGYLGTYALFGNLAMAEGRISDAQAQYEKVLRLAEESKDKSDRQRLEIRGWSGLASVAEARRDWTTATGALRHCLERDPANGSARQRLARALFSSGEVDLAISEIE